MVARQQLAHPVDVAVDGLVLHDVSFAAMVPPSRERRRPQCLHRSRRLALHGADAATNSSKRRLASRRGWIRWSAGIRRRLAHPRQASLIAATPLPVQRDGQRRWLSGELGGIGDREVADEVVAQVGGRLRRRRACGVRAGAPCRRRVRLARSQVPGGSAGTPPGSARADRSHRRPPLRAAAARHPSPPSPTASAPRTAAPARRGPASRLTSVVARSR